MEGLQCQYREFRQNWIGWEKAGIIREERRDIRQSDKDKRRGCLGAMASLWEGQVQPVSISAPLA